MSDKCLCKDFTNEKDKRQKESSSTSHHWHQKVTHQQGFLDIFIIVFHVHWTLPAAKVVFDDAKVPNFDHRLVEIFCSEVMFFEQCAN